LGLGSATGGGSATPGSVALGTTVLGAGRKTTARNAALPSTTAATIHGQSRWDVGGAGRTWMVASVGTRARSRAFSAFLSASRM
jgi:hypothetical protein